MVLEVQFCFGRWVLLGDGYSREMSTPVLSQNSMHKLIRHGGYYPLPRSADKYPKFISSHLTNTISIRNGLSLISTSNTPSNYKYLERTRYGYYSLTAIIALELNWVAPTSNEELCQQLMNISTSPPA